MAKKHTPKEIIDEYHDTLRNAKRYYNQCGRAKANKHDLLSSASNTKKVVKEFDEIKDKLHSIKFQHKEALDNFIVACEKRLRQVRDPEVLNRIHGDLIMAGFNFEKHGVNHPLLQRLDLSIKRGEEFKMPARKSVRHKPN